MMNQAGSSRLDTVLKLLLITFVSLVAFSAGVYLGKEMSTADFQQKAMEPEFSGKKVADKEKGEGGEEALVDEEVNQLAEKLVNAEKDNLAETAMKEKGEGKTEGKEARAVASEDEHAAKSEAKHEEKHEAKHDTKHEEKAEPAAKSGHAAANEHAEHIATHEEKKTAASTHDEKPISKSAHGETEEVQSAATKVAHGEAPVAAHEGAKSATKSEARVPSSLPVAVGTMTGSGFTVQVASYQTQDEAKAHADKLVKKGFPAFPVEANVKGHTWFRVSVGSFKTSKEATNYRAQLMKDSEIKSAIVSKVER